VLRGTVDWEAIEDLVGHVTHQLVDDIADRSGAGLNARSRWALLVLPLLEQREGFLQDRGLRGKTAALDLLADEVLPTLG
jgi:hypothetical protein